MRKWLQIKRTVPAQIDKTMGNEGKEGRQGKSLGGDEEMEGCAGFSGGRKQGTMEQSGAPRRKEI